MSEWRVLGTGCTSSAASTPCVCRCIGIYYLLLASATHNSRSRILCWPQRIVSNANAFTRSRTCWIWLWIGSLSPASLYNAALHCSQHTCTRTRCTHTLKYTMPTWWSYMRLAGMMGFHLLTSIPILIESHSSRPVQNKCTHTHVHNGGNGHSVSGWYGIYAYSRPRAYTRYDKVYMINTNLYYVTRHVRLYGSVRSSGRARCLRYLLLSLLLWSGGYTIQSSRSL